jgi:endonuclease/exonuclease/phosphatase family metal-dependent hydrolase
MVNKFRISSFLLLSWLLLAACFTKDSYRDPNSPRFEGKYAEQQREFEGTINVVTWNIKLSQEIETAITELNKLKALQDADILLLQEMNESGVEAIAEALTYNYVYFPATFNKRHDTNIGNAVLSKWPIIEAQKLLLPHENPANQEIRIAVQALIPIHDRKILVYSVHTETIWVGRKIQQGQVDALIADVDPDAGHVIVGGDFNTVTPKSITALEAQFEQAGFERVSAHAGHTFESKGVKLTLDHIFTKGLPALDAGVSRDMTASDHFPVWATLEFEPCGVEKNCR